jgi:hypothetical protein
MVAAMLASLGAHDASAQSPEASDPYARYARPGQCVQAAQRLDQLYWRDKRQDTVVYAPATDSVPATVVQAARACGVRFTVAAVPERDLLGLVQLYFWTRQDTLARAAADRLLAAQSARPALERGWTLYQLILGTLDVRPVRIEAATRYLATLDAMGKPVSAWRLLAHTALSRYAMSVDSVTAALTHARTALAASAAMTKSDRIDRVFSIVQGYDALAEPVGVAVSGPAAVAVFDTALTDLLPLRGPGTHGTHRTTESLRSAPGTVSPTGDRVVSRAQMEMAGGMGMAMAMGMGGGESEAAAQMMLKGTITQLQQPYTIVGKTAPPLRASHWYNTGSDTGARPVPGAVTLVVSVDANCQGRCYPTYAALRRISDRYHAAGLQIVLMARTAGFFRNQPTPSPASEAEKIRGYVRDFLELPGVVGINETEFTHRMDGRRMNTAGQSDRDYFRGRNAAVVGKDGMVRMVANLIPERESIVKAVIEEELAKQ